MRVSEIADGPTTALSVTELSVVTLAKPVQANEGLIPAGASGTVVHAYGDGRAYIIEFYTPFHAVATVEADAIAA